MQNISSDTSQRVQIFLSARNLLDMDFFSKSDPYIKVFFRRCPNQNQFLIGKTETIDNNLNPNFSKTFFLDYIFQAKQSLRFEVFDEDDGKNDDFIGEVVTSLGALAGARNQTSFLDLQYRHKNKKGGKSPGKLIIRLQPCRDSNVFYQMKWRAVKLLNTDSFFDFWDKSDPYLKFMKLRSDNSYVQAGRTEIIMDNLSPNWKALQISGSKLFKDDSQSRFKVQCWDWQEAGEHKHQFIGELYMDLNQIKSIQKFPFEYNLQNRKHKKPGRLILEHFRPYIRPSFVDYLRGGLQLNLSIAIDFTASNGMPSHPSSLHYINHHKPNQYQIVIDAVSRILLNYDSDQRIPALGFGGKPHYPTLNSSVVNHCFALSGDMSQVQAFGLEHLMGLYNKALTSVELAGPTYFGPIIREAFKIAEMNAREGSTTYQILLILTDGEIHDMDKTVDLLVENCNLPLSIIIVGVGNAEFSNMIRLDGDNGLYNSKGRKAQRDIVQFVPFREVGMNPDVLARELLAELPAQVVQYMTMIGKPPGEPLKVNIDEVMENKYGVQNTEDAMKNQVANMFKEANFFGDF